MTQAAAPDDALARLHAAARAAADLVRSRPRGTRWLLSCDTDADGLCAAAVAFAAIVASGHRATVRASRDKSQAFYEALAAEDFDGHILLDKGTSASARLAAIAAAGKPVVLLDHHNVPPGTAASAPLFVRVNPRDCGLDGSRDASASTTAFAFALQLAGERAWKHAPSALSGAIGDWQHMPGWQGWNLEILQTCRAKGLVKDVPLPRFIGADLAIALSHATPPVPSLDGDALAAADWLRGLGLPPDSEVEELTPEQRARLVSAVASLHLAAGRPQDVVQLVTQTEWNVAKDQGLRQVYRIVDACGREGDHGTGIAYLLGDAGATAQAMHAFRRYREAVADGVRALLRTPPTSLRAHQWAWTSNPEYTGMVAGIGMVHGTADRGRVLTVLALRPDGRVQASTRGLPSMVEAGLDLGRAVHQAAAAAQGEGGGHPVAAGAVIPASGVEPFLAALDEALVAQRWRP